MTKAMKIEWYSTKNANKTAGKTNINDVIIINNFGECVVTKKTKTSVTVKNCANRTAIIPNEVKVNHIAVQVY